MESGLRVSWRSVPDLIQPYLDARTLGFYRSSWIKLRVPPEPPPRRV